VGKRVQIVEFALRADDEFGPPWVGEGGGMLEPEVNALLVPHVVRHERTEFAVAKVGQVLIHYAPELQKVANESQALGVP